MKRSVVGAIVGALSSATSSRHAPRRAADAADDDEPIFRELAKDLKADKWDISSGRCAWCKNRSTGTGTLPLVGAVAYCSNHKPVYQAMRKGQHGRPRHTARNRAVHLRATGWLSGSLCGCEPRYDDPILTENPASVTCVSCQKAMGRHER